MFLWSNFCFDFFSLPAWLPKRPILGRNRNLLGSPCLLSTYSLGSKHYWHPQILRRRALFYRTGCTLRSKFLIHTLLHYKTPVLVPKDSIWMIIDWNLPSLCFLRRPQNVNVLYVNNVNAFGRFKVFLVKPLYNADELG